MFRKETEQPERGVRPGQDVKTVPRGLVTEVGHWDLQPETCLYPIYDRTFSPGEK